MTDTDQADPHTDPEQWLWYVAYGSNLHAQRLRCYLAGGAPPGSRRAHPGCRDRRPPRATRAVLLPGGIYFALDSAAWTGGSAFYDPGLPGHVPARAYLVTAAQFSDIAAQEMNQAPGADLDLRRVLDQARDELGPGCYQTLVRVGELAGHPMLTFTAPWSLPDVTPTAPSAAYLTMLALGLRESHRWDTERIAEYLCGLPGASGRWRPADVAALLTATPASAVP